MARQLDFIIFGVPRSGTKGLVRALNLHPEVYCAMERFHFSTNHSALTFPDSFVDPNACRNRDDLTKIKTIQSDLAAKKAVRHAGNKLPRYFFALDRINREIPHLKNLWIYRSPYGFMPSWNRRELNGSKGQWPAGQVGLFGLLELLVCIQACLNLPKDVLVFPYEQGLRRADDIVKQTLDFLGAAPSLYDSKRFTQAQTKRDNKRQGAEEVSHYGLNDYEEELLEMLRIRDLDEIIHQDRAVMVADIAAPLKNYLASISAVLPGALDRAFAQCSNNSVPSFGRVYWHRHRNGLQGLHRLADGSSVVADFQNFGPYQRLKSLFVRSWH